MDLSLFQRFVKDNFDKIKREIQYGVYDRQDEFRESAHKFNCDVFNIEKDFQVKNGKNVYGGISYGAVYYNGYKGSVYRICLPDCGESPGKGNFESDDNIIEVDTKNGKRLLYLLSEESNTNGQLVLSYTYNREKQTFKAEQKKSKLISYSSILRWKIENVEDDKVWDAIFDFFSIVHAVSENKTFADAEKDIEKTIKFIYGLPCDLCRCLKALGHQYFSYILKAFDINVFDGKDLKTYEDLLKALTLKIESKEKRELKEDFLALYYILKKDRNDESHSQPHFENPRERMVNFLCDQVTLVYVLKYVLGQRLSIKPNNELLTPLYLPEGICIDKKDELPKSEDGAFLVHPFVGYTIYTEDKVNNIQIEDLTVSKWRVEVSDLTLEKVGNIEEIKSVVSYDAVLKEIADKKGISIIDLLEPENLENFKNEIIEKIGTKNGEDVANLVEEAMKPTEEQLKLLAADVGELKTKQETQSRENEEWKKSQEEQGQKRDEKVEILSGDVKTLSGDVGTVKSDLKDTQDKIEANKKEETERWEKEEREKKAARRKNRIIWSLVGVLALILGVAAYLPFNHYARLHFKPAYYVAFNYLGQHDLAFERAEMLEKELIEKYYLDREEFSRKGLEDRLEVAETYRQGIRRYVDLVEADSVENAERAYKLARMYWLGKGGEISPSKSLRYAKIAAAHGHHHHGFAAFMMLRNNEPEIKVKAMLHKAMSDTINDPHLKLADIYLKTKGFEKLDKVKANTGFEELLKKFVSLEFFPVEKREDGGIALNLTNIKGDVGLDAWFMFLDLAQKGIRDSNGNYIFDKNLDMAIMLKYKLMNEQNILPAQISEGLALYNMHSSTALYYFLISFYNGYRPAALLAYKTYITYLDSSENFAKLYPEAFAELGKDHFELTMEGIKEMEESGNYDLSLEYLEQLRKEFPESVSFCTNDTIDIMLKLKTPDSAIVMRQRLETVPFKEQKFLGNPTTEQKHEAITSYRDAMFYAGGLGGFPSDTVLTKKCLEKASNLGMIEAKYTLAVLKEEQGNCQDAYHLMDSIYRYSDRACRWLAEDTKMVRPNDSRKYVEAISDTLDMYKLVRQAQEMLFATKAGCYNGISKNRLYSRLNNSYSYDKFNPSEALILAYMSVMMKLTKNPMYIEHLNNRHLGFLGLANEKQIYDYMAKSGVEHSYQNFFPSTYVARIFSFLNQNRSTIPAFQRDRKLLELDRLWPKGIEYLINNGYVTHEEMEFLRMYDPNDDYKYIEESELCRWSRIDPGDSGFITLKELYDF